MVDKKKQGRSNRRKGGVVERQIVHNHTAVGVGCLRVPLSGAAVGYKGDIKIDILDGLTGEAKSRKGGSGFKTIRRWLGDHDVLFLKEDGAPPMAVIPWPLYSRMVAQLAEGERRAVPTVETEAWKP